MKHGVLAILLASALGILSPLYTWANTPSLLAQTQDLVTACKHTTQRDRMSGITSDTIEGEEHYTQCLIDVSVRLANTYYPADAFGPEGFETQVRDMVKRLNTLYGPVHNQAMHCAGMCGTMYLSFPAAETGRFMEHLIVEMARRCEDAVDDFTVTDAWVRAITGEE